MFSRSGNPLLIFLQSYQVWVASKIQVDFRFNTYSEILVNVTHRFLKFCDYWYFWGQRIQCDISAELSCLGDLENLGQLPSYSRVTQKYWWLYLMDFHNFFTIYVVKVMESIAYIPTELRCLSDLTNPSHLPVWEVLVILSYNFWNFHTILFSRSGNSLLIFLQSSHVYVTSKIQVDIRFNRYSEVLVIVSCRFLKLLHYLCFWGQGIVCWHPYWATMFGGPRKFR